MKKILSFLLVLICTISLSAFAAPHRFYRNWWLGGNLNQEGYQIFHDGRVVNGRAVKLVMSNGRPWVINRGRLIYRWVRGQWQKMPGSAIDITVSRSGRIWVIGTDSPNISGYPIYYWDRGTWQSASFGRAMRFVGRPHRAIKVINRQGMVYAWGGGIWNYRYTR